MEELRIDHDIGAEARYNAALLDKLRQTMVASAYELLGAKSTRYTDVEKGMTPEDFDCSGFVSYVMRSAAAEHGFELYVPRHANEQWRSFGEPVAYKQRQAGDLVFFPSKKAAGIRVIGHVGLVVSKDSYIHAPGKPDTAVSAADLPDEPIEYTDLHPKDIYTHNPAGIKRITLPIGNGRWHVH